MLIRLLLGLGIGTILVLFVLKKHLLTLSGALLALALLLDILLLGGYAPAVYIITVFLLSGLVGKLAKPKKEEKNHRPRDLWQVGANGAGAGLAILLYGIAQTPIFLIAYYAAVAEFFTDTLASDIGVHAKGAPLDLARMKRTERGRSGGVSLLGTAASALGALLCFLLALGAGLPAPAAAIAATTAFFGMLIDSILGSLCQAKYTCRACSAYTEKPLHCNAPAEKTGGFSWITNSTVNLLSNLLTAILAALLALAL